MADPGRYLQCVRTLRDYAGKGCWEAQVCDRGQQILLYRHCTDAAVDLMCVPCAFSISSRLCLSVRILILPRPFTVIIQCKWTVCHFDSFSSVQFFVSFLLFISHPSICPDLELIEALSGNVKRPWQLLTYCVFFFHRLLKLYPSSTTESQKYDSSAITRSVITANYCNTQSYYCVFSVTQFNKLSSHFKPFWHVYLTRCLFFSPAVSGQSVQPWESTGFGVKSLLWFSGSAVQFLQPGHKTLHSGHPQTRHQGHHEVDRNRKSSMMLLAQLQSVGE